jgi:environmental stress-induced protein Ves
MFVVREASYQTVPWKNGGGTTREICREPAGGAAFDWRLSLASIDVPGPFSTFDGYHRTLVLVSGAGVELDFGEHGRTRLAAAGQQVSFDGSWPAHCTLLDGRSTDLNLIVSHERMRWHTELLQLTQSQVVQTGQWSETLVCCISGAIRLINTQHQAQELRSVDVARCSPADRTLMCVPQGSEPARLFVAGLSPRESDPEYRTEPAS